MSSSKASRKYRLPLALLFTALILLPASARAFSLATLVEAHQERMQRRYERMSYKLCSVVSNLLPFVGSEAWCLGDEARTRVPAPDPDTGASFGRGEVFISDLPFGLATDTPAFFDGTIVASTTNHASSTDSVSLPRLPFSI